jgi:PAS domain S-box-containing protein
MRSDNQGGEPDGGVTLADAQFACLLETLSDGVVLIDDQARILVFNKACERLFDYAASEVLGRNVSMLMGPEHAPRHDDFLARYRITGERRIIGSGRHVTARRRDGTLFPVALSVGEVRTTEGRQFVGILHDLRDERALAAQLERLEAGIVNLTAPESGAAAPGDGRRERREPVHLPGHASLTAREREVLALILEGASDHEIGRRLAISGRTAEVHRGRILAKTGLRSTAELIRRGLSQP